MSLPVAELPAALRAAAAAAIERLNQVSAEPLPVSDELASVLAVSEFVVAAAARRPDFFARFLSEKRFAEPLDLAALSERLSRQLAEATDESMLMKVLREVRNECMVHLVWRDVTRRADFRETAASVSALADLLIGAALAQLHGWAVSSAGEPIGEDGTAQTLSVLALGKLGGGELNLSSDVDLVFLFDQAGRTGNGKQSNQQFFTRLAQRLIHVLDATTSDGFVFRVDMRLRPYGDSGALVSSAAVAEQYFEQQGRDWERYAWIRARAVAGDVPAGELFLDVLRPFVYRRYLDFGAIDALRDMKARIDAERRRGAMASDVKLGPGGIREVEFIVQVLQLIWGGRQRQLRARRTHDALAALTALGHLSETTGRGLAEAYTFLRDTEHKIQALRDQQTQRLPEGVLDQARLAHAMGYADYPTFLADLDAHRRLVGDEFEAVIEAESEADDRWRGIWMSDGELRAERLADAGVEPAAELAERLAALKAHSERVSVDPVGRARLDALMPRLLAAVAESEFAGVALGRIVPLLEAVMRRSAYYMLLLENPGALRQLVSLCGASRWLAAELARHPALLDELLDERHLFMVPDRERLGADLEQRLSGVSDMEVALEALRSFKQGHEFRVAACELKGILPLMKISDYLTFIAEVILEHALALAWDATAATTDAPPARAFLIVGYGKLGGLELGPDSDLDMVFIHDLDARYGQFVNRMVRRLLNVLTMHTHSGALYEVDTRLRPSGRSGTMVSSLAAFAQYQQREAWVWEHQALVRARPVAGDPGLARQFDRLRLELLCQPRDVEELRAAVVDMRARIEKRAGDADLKRGAGGIVDIEFMVQYLVLARAAEHPELARFSDNVRILEAAAEVGLLPKERAAALKEAYLALRAERHRAALDIPDDVRARQVLDAHRSVVRACWDDLLG